MPGRDLFSKEFNPRAQLGDIVLLLGQTGFREDSGSSAYEVVGLEPLPALGPHGAIVVWTQVAPAAAPAGYTADTGAATGTIGIGGAATSQALASLKNAQDEVTQLRFLVKGLGTLVSALDDIDVRLFQPGAVKRYSLAAVDGVLNSMFQSDLPTDTTQLPAQGSNMAKPAAFLAAFPFEVAHRTELFIHKDQSPAVSITNNGAAAMNNATGAIALVAAGYKYKVRPIAPASPTSPVRMQDKELLGLAVKVPSFITDDQLRWQVPILPVAGRG